MLYAGIGSRETPGPVLAMMTYAARELATMGWKLRSGGAGGADKAFARGTTNREIRIPWSSYNGLYPNGGRVIVPDFTPEIRANRC